MHYFITSQFDLLTSAIEIAEIQRLKIFDEIKEPAKIITRNFVLDSNSILKKLGISNRVINLFQYFQKFPSDNNVEYETDQLVKTLLDEQNFEGKRFSGYRNGKLRVSVFLSRNKVYYVNYLDQFGFTDRRDFYDDNRLSYSEFFDDGGKLITRSYYDCFGKIILTYHFRGGPSNQPVLTLIQLKHRNKLWQFDNMDELMAYFLDCLAIDDANAVFYSDREDVCAPAFKLMKESAKKYVILHSAFTENAKSTGELYPYIKQVFNLEEKLTGIISSTVQESLDVKGRLPEIKSYAIPVSYLDDKLFQKYPKFEERTPFHLIAVARLTHVKQLDHLINTVILLHQKLPDVDLKIYGYKDNWNNYEEASKLQKIVERGNAQDYVHFCGYQRDLTDVYQKADLEILTSAYEGFAMAVMEALGHRCPVVSYNINYGPGEMICDNVNGRLLPENDTFTLYRTLLFLLQNRNILKSYSQQALSTMDKYSYSNIKAIWKSFVEKEEISCG
ncbi:glycosyltransferase [Liquorilactobacillus uvarum]|uniref:glycosyltransferase n=1 Tax=Liquorilactobacillus uvarum TaxID=303240 RepID=UPI00288AAFB0|nr:glycosyltransferase [Liquorilactobacillus uvarum]